MPQRGSEFCHQAEAGGGAEDHVVEKYNGPVTKPFDTAKVAH
jgi:hypothetical protein